MKELVLKVGLIIILCIITACTSYYIVEKNHRDNLIEEKLHMQNGD